MEATKPAYSVLKNNLLYAMIFLMLLRCDIRKIIKLGPKMLAGFFAASVSISLAFIATFANMKGPLGSEAWKALGALCGSWMGGSGNMIAVQAALDIGEADMAYALVVDSIDYSIWVMFLLWAINLAPKFNKWVKADTTTLDEVSRRLEEDAKGNEDKASFVNLLFLLGIVLCVLVSGMIDLGEAINIHGVGIDGQNLLRDILLLCLAGLSWKFTTRQCRELNGFSWAPIEEVAKLFLGIFLSMIPALAILRAGTDGALAGVINMVFHDGEPAAGMVALPDFNPLLKRLNGKLGLSALWHYWQARGEMRGKYRMILFGIREEFRLLGLPLLLLDYMLEQARRHPEFCQVEGSWVLEDNMAVNDLIEDFSGRITKRYRLYRKEIVS